MPLSLVQSYERWSAALDAAYVMASAAELHGLISGLLCGGMPADASEFLPVLHDFLNDGQALPQSAKNRRAAADQQYLTKPECC